MKKLIAAIEGSPVLLFPLVALIIVAVLLFVVLFVGPNARAQTAQTAHIFTLNPNATLTVPYNGGKYGESYYTYFGTSFDGVAYPYTPTFNEIDHLQSYLTPDIPELFDFNLPIVTLDGCTRTTETVTPLYRYGPQAVEYQTRTTTDVFACQDASSNAYSVVTVKTVNYKLVAGVRGIPSFAVLPPLPPIQGTVTQQQ